jgi:hypothetical protein
MAPPLEEASVPQLAKVVTYMRNLATAPARALDGGDAGGQLLQLPTRLARYR